MSSVFTNWQINGANPVTVSGTGTAKKYFPAPSGNFTSGVSTTPSSTNATGQLNIDGDSANNGQVIVVTASGDVEVGNGGACPSITITLEANTGTLTSPTYTVIASTGAITAQANTNVLYPWFLRATLVGTSGAGTISGFQVGSVDNTNAPAQSVLTNVLSGLDFTAFPVFGLVVAVAFSVSESGNKARMYEFNAE